MQTYAIRYRNPDSYWFDKNLLSAFFNAWLYQQSILYKLCGCICSASLKYSMLYCHSPWQSLHFKLRTAFHIWRGRQLHNNNQIDKMVNSKWITSTFAHYWTAQSQLWFASSYHTLIILICRYLSQISVNKAYCLNIRKGDIHLYLWICPREGWST